MKVVVLGQVLDADTPCRAKMKVPIHPERVEVHEAEATTSYWIEVHDTAEAFADFLDGFHRLRRASRRMDDFGSDEVFLDSMAAFPGERSWSR